MNSPSQKAIYRVAKRKSAVRPHINVWPFVGLLLVSLVAFMVIPTPYQHHYHGDYCPPGPHAMFQPGADREDVIRISVLSDASMTFRNTMVVANDLGDLITAAVKQGSEKKIYLAVDPRVRNRDVEVVLDQIRTAGISKVAILTN